MKVIKYMTMPVVVALIAVAPVYRLRGETELRKPRHRELGLPYILFAPISDPPFYEQTRAAKLSNATYIARDPSKALGYMPGGTTIYHEWIMYAPGIIRAYGKEVLDSLGPNFTRHRRRSVIQALEVTHDLLELLGVFDSDCMMIDCGPNSSPLTVYRGDFLTDSGFPISAEEMLNYERI
jgi:hypothetical protein